MPVVRNEEGPDKINQTQSQICDGIRGPEAIYWFFSYSIPAPLSQVPLIKNPGQQFIHSVSPLLGFTIPTGFAAFVITN